MKAGQGEGDPCLPMKDLDDANSSLGDNTEVASLLMHLSEGVPDTETIRLTPFEESLPELTPLPLHNLTVVVRDDQIKSEHVSTPANVAIIRHL